MVDGGGIQGHFVGSGAQHLEHVVRIAQPAADRERDKDLRGDFFQHLAHDAAALGGGCYVVKDKLVGSGPVVIAGQLDGVAGVLVGGEPDSSNVAAVFYVEAGNNPAGKHQTRTDSAASIADCRSMSPV